MGADEKRSGPYPRLPVMCFGTDESGMLERSAQPAGQVAGCLAKARR